MVCFCEGLSPHTFTDDVPQPAQKTINLNVIQMQETNISPIDQVSEVFVQ